MGKSHLGLLALLVLAAVVMAARKSTASDVRSLTQASPAERKAILDDVAKLGWPRSEVDMVIARESGWRPGAINPETKAVGLIQFMPRTLELLGFRGTPEDFGRMSAGAQRPYVVAFFRSVKRPWRVPGDTYMALFNPAKIGAPDSQVLYAVGTPGWTQNPSLRSPNNGPITAGSVRARGKVA
jgi:hypothetical protein